MQEDIAPPQRHDIGALFEKVRFAAAKRPCSVLACTIQFVVGDEPWLIDLSSMDPDRVVRAELAQHADCTVAMSADTLIGLLDGSLPLMRAWMQKKISVTGDRRHLRSLDWMSSVALGSKPRSGLGGTMVLVRSARAHSGYGLYELVVTEEASCWSIWRRWREVKRLSNELAIAYGKGTPCNLPLPSLPQHSLRPSVSPVVLHYRQRVMDAYLSVRLYKQLLQVSSRLPNRSSYECRRGT